MDVIKLDMIVIPHLNYPDLDNPEFNSTITKYADFNIKGKVYHPTTQQDVEDLAHKMCNSAIELSTYQTVVRNFLSNETPYNGLLLFHGLGTGKTCSAITIAEEHRKFLKRSGMGTTEGRKQREKKIYILGGPNIKSNFRKQLFDVSHLSQKGKEWTCNSCVGNSFLTEINPTGIDITKEEIVKRVDEVIKRHYKFMGYIEFANYIQSIKDRAVNKKIPIQDLITKEYQHCMIIIDEVHNIKHDESSEMTPSKALDLITTHTVVKLLLLSATPIFNDPEDIIWSLNLLNKNDKRYTINKSDYFSHGELKEDQIDNFIHFCRGYVSFVKGENPYTFPYRVYPTYFDDRKITMPTIGMVKNEPFDPVKTKVYPVELSDYQASIYNAALNTIKNADDGINSLKHNNSLIGILNMTYPDNTSELETCMKHSNGKYEYYKQKDKCFDPSQLKKYSAKIHAICEEIQKSTGIVMIYSRLIEKGAIPMAIALESIGGKNIKDNLTKTQASSFTYCLITGNVELSTGNASVIEKINSKENKNGDIIKVVIISDAASEGVDLKNIRQIHIMDPWWHLNKNEQIIGRGIRLCSHKNLPFIHRNAQIFLYVSVYKENELLDHYFYRYAEEKATKVGKIARLLKENAMDCVMNHEQFQTVESMNLSVSQTLSNKKVIDYSIGDTSFSVMCDFMDCDYKCSYKEQPVSIESGIFNLPKTIERIKTQFKHGYVYTTDELLYELNIGVPISKHELYEALTQMVDTKTPCKDMIHNDGYIINRGKYYIFQPKQLRENVPIYERRVPAQTNPHSVVIRPRPPGSQTAAIDLVSTMRKQYEESKKSSGNSWYSIVPSVKRRLVETLKKRDIVMDDAIFNECIIDHMIEMLVYKDCKVLVDYLFYSELDDFEKTLKSYFKEPLCIWNDKKIVKLKEDKINLKLVEIEVKDIPSKEPNKFGTVVGGIANLNEDNRTFKSKSMTEAPISGITYGQVCSQAAKKSMPRIKNVFGDSYPDLSQVQVCCELELLLRYLDKVKHESKRWFLSAVEVIRLNKKVTKQNNFEVVNLLKK